ncbi:cobalt-precorrin-5B (C(1))-methyltransferase [Sporosarcina sp. 179-K 3D1 HS]|uniref:cobalt-precorrin-5B (C(1))-methyltransferase n=1 Tax=Sporosarcina sp. 179-K 3D1 HS TaxID=3232169 RepID=UPI0039A20283
MPFRSWRPNSIDMKKQTEEKKELRHGYTTGTNSTAATKAALLSLILQEPILKVTVTLPIGDTVPFTMDKLSLGTQSVSAEIIKDAGDDPDATHLARIISTVSWNDAPGIELDGGIGVGRVTKPGLPVPVGEAAINPVPRRMILRAAQEILDEYGIERGIKIVISVPDGEEIAKKTLNSRLGIIGGISILGTRGTVVPFSTAAFRASIAQAINVAKENGCTEVVACTGGRSENFAIEFHPHLQEDAFIEMGDFIGFTMKQCKARKMKKVTLVGMMGKFSKVAQGVMMVHSKSAPVDFNFLADLVEQAGLPPELVEEARHANTASQVGDIVKAAGNTKFFTLLLQRIAKHCYDEVGGGLEVEVIVISMKKEILGRESYRGEESD